MKRLLLFCLLLLTGAGLMAQNSVQITTTALPPFDPFLQDYFNQPGKLQVIVRNTTNAQLSIKLLATLTGDNGVELATSPGYQPLQPLVLGPLQTRLLTVSDLRNLIDLSQVTVTGMDKAALLRGQALPEGEYQLCLQAVDIQTNRPLSLLELGCTRIPVRSIEPPILIAPLCDQDVTPQTPQNMVFTWSPPAGVRPTQVEYTLRVVELPIWDVDPNVFIDAVVLPQSGVEVKGLRINSFLYSVVQPALKPGKKYAWRVQARDPRGRLVFLNDGKSPVCAFQYGEPPKPVSQSQPLANVSSLKELLFCGQTITTKKITKPDANNFSGTGTLTITSPVKLSVDVALNNLVIRPIDAGRGQVSYMVVKGTLETSLTGARGDALLVKLKTAPRTGGTAALTCQAIRLVANHSAYASQQDFYKPAKGVAEEAAIQVGLSWLSPIELTTFSPIKSGNGGPPLAGGGNLGYDGNLEVKIPGAWQPIQTTGAAGQLSASLTIPFPQAYQGTLSGMKDFFLNLATDSYFEIKNNVLTARLTGSLKVPSGVKNTQPFTATFKETDGIAFSDQIDGQQIPVGVVNNEARLFLSFNAVNIQLGNLFEAPELAHPQWTKGVSCPNPDLWIGRMVYMQDSDHPTSQDHLEWITVPLNPILNQGKGYESTNAHRKGLTLETKFLGGFKGKITDAIAVIKNSEFKVGHLVGEVYVPFVQSVGYLQIMLEKYGMGDAEVISFDKAERTLLQTPAGDKITVKVTGGYFDGGYFYPDMSISAFNEKDPTRGLDAREIAMNNIDVGISPKGELVSGYVGKKAEALYGGNSQKTAYLNGLDYQLSRVILRDMPGGKQCELSFNGKLILGEKIVTKDEYTYEMAFNKPALEDYSFPNAIPVKNFSPPKKGAGPYSPPDEFMANAVAADVGSAASGPATCLLPVAAKTVKGSFSTSTAMFNATFTLYTDDATYGNGFRADQKILVYQPTYANVEATIIAGKKQGVKYWFAGFKYDNPDAPGIPLFLNLEAYGFEGRIHSHMKHIGPPDAIFDNNYVPDANTSFGLYAALPIQSAADKGKLLWGKTGVEIKFKGFVPNTTTIRGDVNMEQLGGTNDKTTSRIQAYCVLNLSVSDKTLLGGLAITKGDFGVACVTGSAQLYLGPSGFAVSVGTKDSPIVVKAMCGMMGDFTPYSTGYVALYGTNGPVTGFGWIPASGIGIVAHLNATLLNFNTKTYFDTSPWASIYAGADATLYASIRPFALKTQVGTTLSLDVGYGSYSLNLANVLESVQLTLPDFCMSYNKRICFPLLGGCNLIVGLHPTPYIRTNGDASEMCFNDGSVEGPCNGLLSWIMDGVQVLINAAGEVLDFAGNLIKDAAGNFVKGVTVVGGKVVKAVEDVGGAIVDGFCGVFGC